MVASDKVALSHALLILACFGAVGVAGAGSKPPLFFWAQSDDTIFITLKYSLRDIDYKFTPDSMFFSGTDTHKHHAGDNYELQLNFFKAIQNDKCTVEKKARKLVIEIPKAESANWKWLLRDHKKLPYMRYDWTMDPQEEEDPRNERLAKNKKAGKKKTEKIDGLGTVEVGEDGMPADFDDVVDSDSETQPGGSKTFTMEDDLFKKEFKFGILAPIMQPITAVLIENLPRWLVPLAMTIVLFIVLMPVSFLFSWLLARVLPARKKKPKAKAAAQGDTGKQTQHSRKDKVDEDEAEADAVLKEAEGSTRRRKGKPLA